MTHVLRFGNGVDQVVPRWDRDYSSNRAFCSSPGELGSRSGIKMRKDLLFSVSSPSHKNDFNDCAHQYDPGNAKSITRYHIGQIMIAMEYSAQAFKEHKQQDADTQYPFPETRRHPGD